MYNRMTLAETIAALRELPKGSEVDGMGDEIVSYRGYYDRNAVNNASGAIDAHALADKYEKQIGKKITGYKGGDYRVDPGKLLYVAPWGDTGPCLIGLRQDMVSDVWEPILLADDYHF